MSTALRMSTLYNLFKNKYERRVFYNFAAIFFITLLLILMTYSYFYWRDPFLVLKEPSPADPDIVIICLVWIIVFSFLSHWLGGKLKIDAFRFRRNKDLTTRIK